jgi:hypothetical protein
MSHANKATDIHRTTRVGDGTTPKEAPGLALRVAGLGTRDWDGAARLRWTFFDPFCRKSKKPRPYLAEIVDAHASPTRRRFGH